VAVVFGTYNRKPLLEQAVASIRRSVGGLSYRILVADGGSTDGSREWLAAQPDCELLEGGLNGAVAAFNVGFARAVDLASPYVAILNDDDELIGPQTELQRCVEIMNYDPGIGAVALEFDLYGDWRCAEWNGKPSCGKGVVRRSVLMAVARAQGDPDGRRFWDPRWKTYAADSAAGCWIHRLGWTVARGIGLRVHDGKPEDALMKRNKDEYRADGTVNIFMREWGHPREMEYCRADAARFGGRMR
jgi:glycosyltransferase involved in cell wall biosynthesis